MSFRLVPQSVTLNDRERRNGVTMRYLTEFGKHTAQHITAASICGGIYARVCSTCIGYDVVKLVHVRYLIS